MHDLNCSTVAFASLHVATCISCAYLERISHRQLEYRRINDLSVIIDMGQTDTCVLCSVFELGFVPTTLELRAFEALISPNLIPGAESRTAAYVIRM